MAFCATTSYSAPFSKIRMELFRFSGVNRSFMRVLEATHEQKTTHHVSRSGT